MSMMNPTDHDPAETRENGPYRRSVRDSDVQAYHTDPNCPVGARIDQPVPADPDGPLYLCGFCEGEAYKATDADWSIQRALMATDADEVPALANDGGDAA